MEGDSVTLYTGVNKSQQERIKWYFNSSRIAEITQYQRKICTDEQCDERFRARLEVDHQTGSLTITDIRIADSGLCQLEIISRNTEIIFNVTVRAISAAELDKMKKMGESVSLDPGVIQNPDNVMMWYFNDTHIAEITGDQSEICEDEQCKDRFRDRLKLDHQTGSLTIMKTRTTDSGLYYLQINSSRFSISRSFSVSISGDQTDDVSVMEGDSVTLHTGFKHIIREGRHIRTEWYFNDIHIAQRNGSVSKICTDLERFRDRLKLNRHTGDLTIRHIRTSDSGLYKLQINIRQHCILKMFNVAVDVPVVQRDEIERNSVKEGESLTLYPGVIKNLNDVMTWHFNHILFTEIIEDLSFTCTHDPCTYVDGRFRDTLNLDNQTGSLTITNITTEHAGHYHLKINSSRFSIKRTFSVTVNGSGQSSAGIQCMLLLFCCSWLQLLV
ncbi:hypothetical protein G5714_021265 [Onychostoma macrolepis]|uniref:Immunoglobulin domain-containing protein n=2 Tax=Onychostoma macrolepis TaxID=369639 RepID=A0A7J6BQJ2_9TELE|nr:hypothetical protein G5714_021265 [Onychostoma macrolepis]